MIKLIFHECFAKLIPKEREEEEEEEVYKPLSVKIKRPKTREELSAAPVFGKLALKQFLL